MSRDPSLLLLGPLLLAAAPGSSGDAGEEPLDVERVLALAETLRIPPGTTLGWMPDGAAYLAARDEGEDGERRVLRVEVAGGGAAPLFAEDEAARAFAALPELSEEAGRAIARRAHDELGAELRGALRGDGELAWWLDSGTLVVDHGGDLYAWRPGRERAVRLTSDPVEEVGATLSPDGLLLAYLSGSDLHVVPAAGGAPRALAAGGHEDLLRGRLDWIYQEELYGRGDFQGFWWSPDSTRIAFLELDERDVPRHVIVDPSGDRLHPEVQTWRYPKAGEPNPRVRVAVVDAAGGEPRHIDLAAWSGTDLLVVRVGWTPDGELALQLQDRTQTWLDLCLADPATGAVRRLFRDRTPVWIEPTDAPLWLADGRFLWLSERDGYRHLYLYERSGELVRRLTEGAWEVEVLHGCDEERGVVWLSADKGDALGRRLWTVPLAGGEPRLVTPRRGVHGVSLAPDRRHFLDASSARDDWGRVELVGADGKVLRTLWETDPAPAVEAGLRAPEYVTFEARDGTPLDALYWEPAGFDPARRWPVVSFCYGGPGAPKVRDANLGRDGLYHQMLAQRGYLVWVCDNRSASGKGLAWAQGVHRELGRQELSDLEDGIDWLVEQGLADPERVALWGWSYGGFVTSYAMTRSERFKVGIAGGPVTDWRLYDSIYTERYMGLPGENAEGYARSSVLEAAASLSGPLLLIHGAIDENVHVDNTLKLAEALQKAGKPFQLMLYPANRHGVTVKAQRRHLYETMADFLRRNL